jgi:hypothetical protein
MTHDHVSDGGIGLRSHYGVAYRALALEVHNSNGQERH